MTEGEEGGKEMEKLVNEVEESLTLSNHNQENDENNDDKEQKQGKKKYLNKRPKPSKDFLPSGVPDEVYTAALNQQEHAMSHQFPLICGLLLKLRSALFRVYGRSENKFPRVSEDEQPQQFYDALLTFLQDPQSFQAEACWTVTTVWEVAEELTSKSLMLSHPLQRELHMHPLYTLEEGLLKFHASFLQRIAEYHDTVRRPEGTFTLPNNPRLDQLLALDREKCPQCLGQRKIYCGPCGGLRMSNADKILPPRLHLPFDVLLLLHHHESLVKCTGIHTGVLCTEGSVSYMHWNKPAEEWQLIAESLDPSRDVILFPYQDSTIATEFPWDACHYESPTVNAQSASSSSSSSISEEVPSNVAKMIEVCNSMIPYDKNHRWRLVVLEASWGYGKTMANNIVDHRKAMRLPPVPSVILTDVTGQYWRFHSEGNAAVSTIEAIAHAAKAAGVQQEQLHDLLTLFEMQKYRVLTNTCDGIKAPRAVEVEGVGSGSWKRCISVADK